MKIYNKSTNELILEVKDIRSDLRDAKLPPFSIVPEEGSFIAWKKASGFILKLEIHRSAKRTSNLVSRKCRGSKVKTLEIQNLDGTKAKLVEYVLSNYNPKVKYKTGKVTRPLNGYNDDVRIDCVPGIHFFITRQEAVNY